MGRRGAHLFSDVTTGKQRMRDLFTRLAALGFTETWVREHVLPDWWDDDAADHPVGFTEAIWIIARHLGIAPAVLRGQQLISAAGPRPGSALQRRGLPADRPGAAGRSPRATNRRS